MNIVVFSLGIIFKDKVQGGSQKVLYEISKGLGERGHKITIYCPYRWDNSENFEITDGVSVKPVLPLKGTFPLPYDVSPFDLYKTSEIMLNAISNADLLYCHDGGLNIEFLKTVIPTVISLRDFCYPETLLGALNFQQSAIIVNSDHTYRCLYDSFARINPNIKDKVFKVYNGYSSDRLSKREITDSFLDEFMLPKKSGIVIGYPHRPQEEKGFIQALKVIKRLKKSYPNVKLLIPLYMDKDKSERTNTTYQNIFNFIEKENLKDNVIFHRWITYECIGEYFSYCNVILCIGNFVEAFSNVATEALLCSTPVVAANVATYRTMPIRDYINLVNYDDIDETCKIISRIIEIGYKNPSNIASIEEAKLYIEQNLSIEKCVDNFEKIFINVLYNKNKNNQFENKIDNNEKLYRLTSWCSYVNGKIYDDYRGCYLQDHFNGLFQNNSSLLSLEYLIQKGISTDIIKQEIEKGIIIEDV